MAWGAGLVGGAALLLLAWVLREVILLAFAGVLLALVFRTPAGWLARRTRVPAPVAVALVIVALLALLAGAFWLRGAEIRAEVRQLSERLPAAVEQIEARLAQSEIGREVVERVPAPGELVADSASSVQGAARAVSRTAAVLGKAGVVFFLGVVLALSPAVYVRNGLRLIAPARRPAARRLLEEIESTLRWWLLGRLISMSVIGIATWIGLTLLGMPLAFVLALLAALLSFVPNIGPVVAAVPAVLLGLVEGPEKAVAVIVLYLGVQAVESWVLDPVIDRKTVYLPPALTVVAQVAMGVLTGLTGVALATPLAAMTVVATRRLYVEGVLKDEVP